MLLSNLTIGIVGGIDASENDWKPLFCDFKPFKDLYINFEWEYFFPELNTFSLNGVVKPWLCHDFKKALIFISVKV